MTRTSIVLTGLLGLLGAVVLTVICMMVMAQGWISVIFSNALLAWGLFLFLAVFSVAEIPVMVVGMRRIAGGANPRAGCIVLVTNGGFTFFGAVYAAPFILLTGNLVAGAMLALLSVVRFIAAVVFLPMSQQKNQA